jgi:hypothetical protein
MFAESLASWLIYGGLGAAFQGALILVVGGLPHVFRAGESPKAEKGSREAFGIFWLDQYSYIGLVLVVAGLGMALLGWFN